ncbi:MAG: hypothetical protein OXP69_12765 [Spirochaetaceae bacterium]|nr:hypothetical protein [Spirochaetaceae bacterium]
MSGESIAIVGAAVGMLAVLVPLLLTLAAGIRRELDHVRADVAEARRDLHAEAAAIRADVAEVRRDLHALAERVARIEGAMNGPWRPPANRSPAPAPTTARETPA